MQFHGILDPRYVDTVERFYPVMKRLQEEGKIRFIGFSDDLSAEPDHAVVVRALRTHPDLWDTVMLKYGILNQLAANEALPLAQQHNTGVLNMAPVRVSMTQRDVLLESIADLKEQGIIDTSTMEGSDPLGWLVHDEVDSVISAGYKFAADHPAISTVLTGTANIEHLEANAAALERPSLPEGDKQRLVELFAGAAIRR